MKRFLVFFAFVLIILPISPVKARQTHSEVALAYVHEGIVKLADSQGNPIYTTGPQFQPLQSARLFWSPDGQQLYISRRDGLYLTTSVGGAATLLPGTYGLTVTLDRTGHVFYYLETSNPQATDTEGFVTYPLRELNAVNLTGGTGRLVGYIGNYSTSANLTLYGAAVQYARDGGLLGPSRPQLFTTYGETLFYSCCFPEAGMNALNLITGDTYVYLGAETLITGTAAINNTFSRLAGPTTNGKLLILDLITGGIRNYVADVGEIERVAWSPDDTSIYLAARTQPTQLLLLNPSVTTDIDLRSASISIWRLDLVTSQTVKLATLGDFYGVPSMAVTENYVFVVVVEKNLRLVDDLNAGRLPGDISLTDSRLMNDYLPNSILYRVRPDGSEAFSFIGNVWGVVARPK